MRTIKLLHRFKKRFEGYTFEQKKAIIEDFSRNIATSDYLLIPMKDNNLTLVKIKEITHIQRIKKEYFVHTLNNEDIQFCNNTFNVLEHVCDRENDFFFLNKELVVNMNEILSYNSYYRQVIFKNQKEVVVTGAAMENIIIKKLGRKKDTYSDTYFWKESFI